MTEHEIKCWPEYFNEIWELRKTFELRKNDRDYKVWDTVVIREWSKDEYTGRYICGTITYVIRGPKLGLKEGYCIFQIWRLGMYTVDPAYWKSCIPCKFGNHCGKCDCCEQ